jgi:hypothetical protein
MSNRDLLLGELVAIRARGETNAQEREQLLAELMAMRARDEINAQEFDAARKMVKSEHPANADAAAPKRPAKTNIGPGMRILIGLGVLVAIFSMFSGTDTERPSQSDGVSSQAKADPLDMMETVFVGNHSRAIIEYELRRAMQLYGSPNTRSEMLHWSDVLVALRLANKGVTEMEMLRCMYDMRRASGNVSIPYYDAAALCATGLALGL